MNTSFSEPTSCEELLANMVSFETVNPEFGGPIGGEARLANYLEQLARAWGFHTERIPVSAACYNLLITCPTLSDCEWILFESHLDTVGIDGMSVPPLALTVAGERLHGRGTCDTKGSGAAMLWALREQVSQKNRPWNAGIVFTVDEEAGMTGAQAFARMLARFARIKGIIVGEPTGLSPVVAHNGAVRWRTITRGIAAHSSDPTKGRSAIASMVRVIDALDKEFIPRAVRTHPLTGRAAASINIIRGGTAVNVIPDYCEIECDRRLVPGEQIEAVLAERDQALAGLEVEHDRLYLAPPLSDQLSSCMLAWMSPAFAPLGLDATPRGALYATDASHYAASGAPVLVLGPGDIAQAHTHDEWLDRRQLNAAVSLYRSILSLPA